jgi:hypothetical protein
VFAEPLRMNETKNKWLKKTSSISSGMIKGGCRQKKKTIIACSGASSNSKNAQQNLGVVKRSFLVIMIS